MSAGDQLGLFAAGPVPDDPGDDVAPVPWLEDVARLAERLPAGVRLGTSSWNFPGWAGVVYAGTPQAAKLARHGLPAYAACPLHRTVGLDRAFYRPPPEQEFRSLAAQVPDGFQFLVKAWQGITRPDADESGRTHGDTRSLRGQGRPNPDFLDVEKAVDLVIGPAVRGLGDRLGPIVFQFPPLDLRGDGPFGGVNGFLDVLEPFIRQLPRRVLIAVEARNREVFSERHAGRFAGLLASAGVCAGFAHHPTLPGVDVQAAALEAHGWGVREQPALVCRWLLRHDQTYDGAKRAYGPFNRLCDADLPTRAALAGLAAAASGFGKPGFFIVNNKAEGSAPLSVRRLAGAIADKARGLQ